MKTLGLHPGTVYGDVIEDKGTGGILLSLATFSNTRWNLANRPVNINNFIVHVSWPVIWPIPLLEHTFRRGPGRSIGNG